MKTTIRMLPWVFALFVVRPTVAALRPVSAASVPRVFNVAASDRPSAPGGRTAGATAAAHELERVRSNPVLLEDFLLRMPKGGDLHNHLSGAIYAESFLEYAAKDGLCVDTSRSRLLPPPCGDSPPASGVLNEANARNRLIDAWSMRNFHSTPDDRSGHDHFFATFSKFGAASSGHTGDMLAEVAHRAAVQHETYLELMLGPDEGKALDLGSTMGWSDDLAALRTKLLANGMGRIVAGGREHLDEAEDRMRQVLGCGGGHPDPGCGVTVRYIYQVLRAMPKESVFSQLLAGFEMASVDPRVVGLNIVQPEDDPTALHDFELQMQMLDYLHGQYPKVHITLHAGELAPGLVPPDDLAFHIRESVEKGHAERIGHGVDVAHERDSAGLLAELARLHVLVEICLTSNDGILQVSGADHPLLAYLHAGVPVALATDDEGVNRSQMTWEFERAVQTYALDYDTLKRMVRDSLDHGFLPGSSLWSGPERFTAVTACATEPIRSEPQGNACRKYLDGSEKARLEWNEEVEFDQFEAQFAAAARNKHR